MLLRVAILCEYPTLNGGERSMLACAERLTTSDVELTFLAPPHGPLAAELARLSLRQVAFDLHPAAGRIARDEAVARLVESCDSRFDLLHANSLSMGRLTGAAAGRLAIPCTAHLRDIIGLSPAAIRDLNGNAALIAVSQAVREFHVAQGLADERTVAIYNGIDAGAFRALRSDGWLRDELRLPESAILVAAIGQICLRKGQDVFAEAAVRAAAALPDAHFVLIGSRHSAKPESIAFEADIAARFAAAGLSERFHPLGERGDVPEILGGIDVLVHAARQEPFGRVLLEAAAAGVAIVATDVGGTREMLTDGEHALLVPADDPAAMAEAVARVSRDAGLRLRLCETASDHVARSFPIERAASELLGVWRSAHDASLMHR